MTRVSDRPEFASAVADGGALPFLALALMRGDEVRGLLRESVEALKDRAWGVGVLGFVTPELRREQTDAILEARPPFALIAGGRPDQAKVFEDAGIETFLHVPSPGLMTQFLRDGARRFVLEGRECGGHVGPRSSFVLWEQASQVLLDAFDRGVDPNEVRLLYAGGVHDARSAALVAAVSAPLAARGVKVGVLVGTAYLFTREIVETGAVVEAFQREALRCTTTVMLETGPGHQVRVSPSPFTDRFERERQRLSSEGLDPESIRSALESLNVGRLRIAAKGVDRTHGIGSALAPVSLEDQLDQGLYMLGQAATLRGQPTTIADLHREISEGSARWLDRPESHPRPKRKKRPRPSDVAIVGMAAILPGAVDVRRFWENTLGGRDAIVEVPSDRWDWRLYYDADPKAPDKITSRWGGFVPEVPFDPLRYGMPPTSLPSIEPLHLLTLEVVRSALEDAGYRDRAFPRERTAVVLGAGGGAAQLAMGYAFRSYLPLLDTVSPGAGTEALAQCKDLLPEWTEDSFPGILLNVAAGRIANRFDLGGANYTVDAACGSSLAAASLAVRELESGAADMVVLGGADTVQNPFTYLAFSKTHAFSARGRCRPFDAGADGIVISEGVAVVILKRLADAERDGDRIYSVIKGLGASSDGRAKGLTAPRFEGQVRALRRAYDKSGVSPATVGYVEAHGTGTAAGDMAEASALKDVFGEAGAAKNRCALGSVKSLIGHTKCAAGLAGLINASLALHHRVFPPTIGIETPNPKAGFEESPFHLSTRPRPWIKSELNAPRRAGVSAFGFGGTNFHAVLEAYEGDPERARTPLVEWPSELFVWRATDRSHLFQAVDRLDKAIATGPVPALRDVAHTLVVEASKTTSGPGLAIVANSPDDLRVKIGRATQSIRSGATEIYDPTGIAFDDFGRWAGSKVAFLFPGQGSQYPEMLGELAVLFPEVLDGFESFDAALVDRGFPPVGPIVFPPPAQNEPDAKRQKAELASPENAQPALGAASLGLSALLASLQVKPDMLAGHSYGELMALHYAGSYPLEALAELSRSRGQFLIDAVNGEPGAMAAIQAGPDEVASILGERSGVVIANRNGPKQTVISGPREEVARGVALAGDRGWRARLLPVACGFHSPLVAGATAPLVGLASKLVERGPTIPVYSNVTAMLYEPTTEPIAQQLGDHLASPVRFTEMISQMHDDGARVFVEVGPGSVLTSLVESILLDRPHLAVACEPPGKKGLTGLLATLGRLFVSGVALDLRPLTATRAARALVMKGDRFEQNEPVLSPSTWLVNGTRARPLNGPEPARFGQGPALPPPKHPAAPLHSAKNGNGHVPHRADRPPHRIVADLLPTNGAAEPTGAVFSAFQQTMQKFLDVQRSTMLGFLATDKSTVTQLPAKPVEFHRSNGNGNGHVVHAPTVSAPTASTNGHPEPKPVAREGTDSATIERRLLAIVRDRTGYPAEMLRLDLDLEADLGIDSIKRVEILGTLRDSLPAVRDGSETELMDQLARSRTLGAIVERVTRHFDARHLGEDAVSSRKAPSSHNGSTRKSQVRRMVVEAVEAPLSAEALNTGVATGGLVLISEDGRGVAADASRRLREKGYKTLRVAHGPKLETSGNGEIWSADLTSPESISALVERVRTKGQIAGVLHALPLGNAPQTALDPNAWRDRLAVETRGLFLIAKACGTDLERASGQGGASLVAATAMGGAFASLEGGTADFFAGHGAVAGLVKTLAREWDKVRAKVVDFDPNDNAEILAERLVQELLTTDRRPEVGYLHGRRIALKAVNADLPKAVGTGVKLRLGDPILVTGGARGITAAVVSDFVKRWRPTLLLIGSSPLPTDTEALSFAGIDDPVLLKTRLHEQLGRDGKAVRPTDLERAYQDLVREREIRANLKAFRDAGSTVEYARVDVTDAVAVAVVMTDWRKRHGPIAGLIHGAGIIQDKLLCDKSPESFDRVVRTKLESAVTLARLIEPESLKFAAFFSSVAGRFGNKGQSDYAAANDGLNKLAVWLSRRWPARVVSVMWGPWSGVGMVSELEAHLGRRGLGMISPAEGSSRLADELLSGATDVEVVVAGDLGNLAGDTEADRQP